MTVEKILPGHGIDVTEPVTMLQILMQINPLVAFMMARCVSKRGTGSVHIGLVTRHNVITDLANKGTSIGTIDIDAPQTGVPVLHYTLYRRLGSYSWLGRLPSCEVHRIVIDPLVLDLR